MRAASRKQAATGLTDTARRIIRLNYGFQLLFNLLWWMPVFYAYQKAAGLSDGQIFGIQSIYYVAFCLFEIPTGLIADRIGTRNCLRAGAVVMTAANLAPVVSASYTGFLVHFLAIAAGRSLTSGAASAYLYDGLRAEKCDDHYLKAEGTARALGLVAKVVCWPLVGPLMAVAHPTPYVLSAASAAGSVVCAVALPRIAGADGRTEKGDAARRGGAFLRDAGTALRCVASSRWLALVMVQGVAIFTLSRICQVNLFQPILLDHGIAEASHGGVMAAMTVAEAVASARPQWLSRRLPPVAWVSILSLALAGSLAAMTFGGPWAVVVLLCVFAAATGFAYPIQRKLVNDAVPADAPRATLLSVESIVDRAVCALAAIAAGAYLAAGRLDALLWHSALATAVLLGVFQLLLRSGVVRREPGGRAAPPHPPAGTPAGAGGRPGTERIRARRPR
ncbi:MULTISPECIES: MFS transporter [Streptomyces]|uniref:MFS transporter n=1 Tax=Streptomyces venezuelae TaxID=54571 RepID=A0A5P2BL27_STRVZ|nr:MFS transporter [Streptomyces venezuelae]MYY81154.1 MFS transporter [Streptomyces sp. SID335]MYZ13784.1 MFS transporter [Streptomyces sp. SID337]NDZ86814.1 MFS transporter [Streptomyces sp. SID10115]NEB49054.1 MFS transporter [Streptomyces sp. SID339]QES30730.1 MFS transporter [Streptomyces venezuelae]